MKPLLKYTPLWLLVVLAFCLRLYRIDYPLLDWHSFRQVDTASVTQEYSKNGVTIFVPKYHDLSNIQSGFDNPEGYRMVEFPFINAGIASLIKAAPFLPLVPTSRFVSILFSLGSIIAIFFISKLLSGKRVAYLATLTFAVLPYSVYYSRAVLPEPALVFFSTASLAFFAYAVKQKRTIYFFISALLLTTAFLLKPFVGFLAPVYLTIAILEYKKDIWKQWPLYIFLLTPLPFLAWRSWIEQFPTGIPVSDWLFNGDGIRFRPAWFRWLFYERLTKMFLGFFGVAFLPLLLRKISHDMTIYVSWWIGMLLYWSVLATGNVRHDYYQVILTPLLSITVAYGAVQLYDLIAKTKRLPLSKHSKHLFALGVCVVLFIAMLIGSWQAVKGFFNVNNWEYVEAGQRVDELTPADALVIAPAFGDTSFLFQTNRRGWPLGFEIEDKIYKGATHYVSTSYDDEARELEKKYFVIEKTEKYIIIDLQKTKQ